VSISLHPGTISTDIARNASVAMKIFGQLITYPTSYGAITSLYAGTTPAAAELNGKVGIISASRICPWLVNLFMCNQMFFFSISLPGHASRLRTRRHSIPSSRRNCGNGVKNKSRTSSRVPIDFLDSVSENRRSQPIVGSYFVRPGRRTRDGSNSDSRDLRFT
jgi:hypothetical protein